MICRRNFYKRYEKRVFKVAKAKVNPTKILAAVVIALGLLIVFSIIPIMFVLGPLGIITHDQLDYLLYPIIGITTVAVILTVVLLIYPELRITRLSKNKYDFTPFTPGEETVYESRIASESFSLQKGPFDEFSKAPEKIVGYENIVNFVYEIAGDERTLGGESKTRPDEFHSFFVIDKTKEKSLMTYATEVNHDGENLVYNFYSYSRMVFSDCGIECQGRHYDYGGVTAELECEVYDFVRLTVRVDMGAELSAYIKLDGKIIALLKKYNIKVKNDNFYYFVTQKPSAAMKYIIKNWKRKI